MRSPQKLLIVTECEHWCVENRIMAPEHFVAEIELWAKMFEEIQVLTEFKQGEPSADAVAYHSQNIDFEKTKGADRPGLLGKLLSLHRIPPVILKLWWALGESDAVHVRAPCRNALLTLLLLKMRPRPGYYKYAAMWNDAQAPITWKFEQYLLTKLRSKAVVTVYGSENAEYSHFRSTPTTSLDQVKIAQLIQSSAQRPSPPPFYFLWVGNFGPMKDVPTLLRAFALLPKTIDVRLQLVGNGRGLVNCQVLTQELNIEDKVKFLGRLGWQSLVEIYGKSHCFILPSKNKEGWGKVLMEAMAAELPCIVSNIGALSEVVGYGERGIVVPPESPVRLANAMLEMYEKPLLRTKLGEAGAKFSRSITITHLVDQYRRWLEEAWDCELPSLTEVSL